MEFWSSVLTHSFTKLLRGFTNVLTIQLAENPMAYILLAGITLITIQYWRYILKNGFCNLSRVFFYVKCSWIFCTRYRVNCILCEAAYIVFDRTCSVCEFLSVLKYLTGLVYLGLFYEHLCYSFMCHMSHFGMFFFIIFFCLQIFFTRKYKIHSWK